MPTNREILARMQAAHAIGVAQRGPQPSPQDKLMAAVEEAIADARRRRQTVVAEGGAGTKQYLVINEQIARWESARRNNR